MKFIFLLLLSFLSLPAMAGNLTAGNNFLDFGVLTFPTDTTASGASSFRVIYFHCDGVGQSTGFYRGEDYRVPAGKSFQVLGVCIDMGNLGTVANHKFGYHSTPVQDAQTFNSGTGEIWPDSASVATQYDYVGKANSQECRTLTGPQWKIPASNYPLCYVGSAAGSFVKMYGIEE